MSVLTTYADHYIVIRENMYYKVIEYISMLKNSDKLYYELLDFKILDSASKNKLKPVFICAKYGFKNLIELMVEIIEMHNQKDENNIDLFSQLDSNNNSLLHIGLEYFENHNNIELINLLINNLKENMEYINSDGQNILEYYFMKSKNINYDIIKLIFDKLKINYDSLYDLAISKNDDQFIKLLIEYKHIDFYKNNNIDKLIAKKDLLIKIIS